MTTRPQPADEALVQQVMADLEQRVRQRRRLLGQPTDATSAGDAIRAVTDNWHISAHLPITWTTPIIGRAVALAKRGMRLLLRWYINPIIDQQNEVNAAMARAFVHLAAQQETLARAVAELERRVQALEPPTGPGAEEPGGAGEQRQG